MKYHRLDQLKEQAQPNLFDKKSAAYLTDFIADETYASNTLAGCPLLPGDVRRLLSTPPKAPTDIEKDVLGYAVALQSILALPASKTTLTQELLLNLHITTLRSAKQRWREEPYHFSITQEAPLPADIGYRLNLLLLLWPDLKKQEHPIDAAAIFHLTFEGIRPFADGNGRIGRLVLNLQLLQAGFLPISFRDTDQSNYLTCFERYYKTGDAEPFAAFIAARQEDALNDYMRKAGDKNA